ncbi:MAG: DNA cytosine methyltransferase [Actinomyces ruminicola]|nr:DNA cytosine methyltransferase [Actinomyces ruminicola]
MKLERLPKLTLPRHPDAPTEQTFTQWCLMQKAAGRPLAIDLFSGAGGLGVGVEAAGWTVVAAVDRDETALQTHQANFRGKTFLVDMADPDEVGDLIEQIRPLGIDLVAGGPPCQPFSRAGRAKIRSLVDAGVRDQYDARKDLWRSFVEVVLEIRPRAVLMENVPDMAIGDDLFVIRSIADILEREGYDVDYRLLDAWSYGVPQHRKRFFLQARNDGTPPAWPHAAAKRYTVRDAIEDLPRLHGTTGAREMPRVHAPHSELALSLSDNSSLIYDHLTRAVRADDKEAFSLMTPSTLYTDLPEHLRRYRSDTFKDKYKRLDWDGLSRTITAHIAKDGYWYIHPSESRTLTVREAARIQTFPDSFRFAGSRSDAYRQIGNAVPPALGRAVASQLIPHACPNNGTSRIASIRLNLSLWGRRKRRTAWWLFPGPLMTPSAAAVAALLEVHRLHPSSASAIMRPLAKVSSLSIETLSHIDKYALSRTRRESLQRLLNKLQPGTVISASEIAESILTDTQKRMFSLLCGNNEIVLNDHVRKVVAVLMDLPADHSGLRSDIKVAVAQLLTNHPDAALRMCSLRAIDITDVRTSIMPEILNTAETNR